MIWRLGVLLPANYLTPLFDLSPKRTVALAAAVFLVFACIWYVLWTLPFFALFRKPIERSGKCPLCGSRDFRISYANSSLDGIRRKLGLLPFRCRGCTKRFIRRSSGNAGSAVPSGAEAN